MSIKKRKVVVACLLSFVSFLFFAFSCFIFSPLKVEASEQVADGYTYHSTLYYDVENPYNDVGAENAYAYQCYVSLNFQLPYKPALFIHNGKIVRDKAINENLLKMYFAQNEKNSTSFQNILKVSKEYLAISNQLKFSGLMTDIGSIASKSLGTITSTYLMGGASTLDAITEIVGKQTVKELSAHLIDIAQIITDTQLNYFYLTAIEIETELNKLNKITDFSSFENCENYFNCAENLYRLVGRIKELTAAISADLEKADSFFEVLSGFIKDVGKGFVGSFAEYIISYDKFAQAQKANPEHFAKIINFAAKLAKCEKSVGAIGEVIVSAIETGIGDLFNLTKAYNAYYSVVTHKKLLESANGIALGENPTIETEEPDSSDSQVPETSKVTLADLQAKFPHGKYWNHTVGGKNNPDGYTSTPCKHHTGKVPCSHNACKGDGGCCYYGQCGCNSYGSAIQCSGFAFKLGFDAFGKNPKTWTKVYNLNNLKAGDIIRYGNHSIFVTAVNGNTITFGDCNYEGTCKIRWNQTISKSTVSAKLSHVYSAPVTLDGDSSKNYIATDFNPTIKNGVYALKSAHKSGNMLNVYDGSNSCVDGTKLTTWSKDGTSEQKFYFEHVSAGKYLIYAVCSGKSGSVYKKVVDVNVGSNGVVDLGDGFDVWSRDTSWNNCQLFYIVSVGDGKYVIELASKPNAVLATKNATEAAKNGGAITLRNYSSITTQQWCFYDESGSVQVDPSIDSSDETTTKTYCAGNYKVSESAGLNIRAGASTSYKKLDALKNNTSITVVQVDGNWGKIIHDGTTGWICLDYTTFVSPIISSIFVKTMPVKTEYTIGETLDTTSLEVGVNYSDGTTKTLIEGFVCEPMNFDSVGIKTIAVSYNDFTTSFDVNVVGIENEEQTSSEEDVISSDAVGDSSVDSAELTSSEQGDVSEDSAIQSSNDVVTNDEDNKETTGVSNMDELSGCNATMFNGCTVLCILLVGTMCGYRFKKKEM